MLFAACILGIAAGPANAGQTESWYVNRHCKGEIEYRLQDGTRVDCLTDTHAIEYDFALKWHEAIGQALHYSRLSGKRAGIVLILEKKADLRSWDKMLETIRFYGLPVDCWQVKTNSFGPTPERAH